MSPVGLRLIWSDYTMPSPIFCSFFTFLCCFHLVHVLTVISVDIWRIEANATLKLPRCRWNDDNNTNLQYLSGEVIDRHRHYLIHVHNQPNQREQKQGLSGILQIDVEVTRRTFSKSQNIAVGSSTLFSGTTLRPAARKLCTGIELLLGMVSFATGSHNCHTCVCVSGQCPEEAREGPRSWGKSSKINALRAAAGQTNIPFFAHTFKSDKELPYWKSWAISTQTISPLIVKQASFYGFGLSFLLFL